MFHVYVLKSEKNNRLYIGSTQDIDKRLAEHNAGKSKATRYTKPFHLVHSEKYYTRSDVVKRERFLKTGQGRNWLKSRLV